MAIPSSVLTVAIIVVICLQSHCSDAIGGLIGGRTKVKDVKTNKEIQDLGRFSVEQYNSLRRSSGSQISGGTGDEEVRFREVVEAETQVVSGIKYYMKIRTETKSGTNKTFDAVLVVKPWSSPPKQLLQFTPSSSSFKSFKVSIAA